MTLGEFITKYRLEHDLSQRAFAAKVNMSVQQIANIERGIGNNGKPMTSNMRTYTKIAAGLGIDETDFFRMLNDSVVVNSRPQLDLQLFAGPNYKRSDEDQELIDAFHALTDDGKAYIRQQLDIAKKLYKK